MSFSRDEVSEMGTNYAVVDHGHSLEQSASPPSSARTHQSEEINTRADGAGSSEILPLVTDAMSSQLTDNGRREEPGDKSNENEPSTTTLVPPEHMKVLVSQLQEMQVRVDQLEKSLEQKDKELEKLSIAAPPANKDNNGSPSRGDAEAFGEGIGPKAEFRFTSGSHAERLQAELLAAQKNNDELNRMSRLTVDHVLNNAGESASPGGEEISEQTLANIQSMFADSTRTSAQRVDAWSGLFDDGTALPVEFREQSVTSPYNRNRAGIWGSSSKPQLSIGTDFNPLPAINRAMDQSELYAGSNRVWGQGQRFASQTIPSPITTQETRFGGRRASYNPQAPAFVHSGNGMDRLSPTQPLSPSPIGTPYQQTPDFNNSANTNIWNTAPTFSCQGFLNQGTTNGFTNEPMNYRKLLDRQVVCNWKYIVDRIISHNDQQASIFLQQKLKMSNSEQRHLIIDAIVAQSYPLMINRFGNFLIQRCFEHGTQEQTNVICNAIRGNTVALSMDAFGCHVVQKALDCVPEEFKATMVSELLRRIPETVVHRYACHVWQKLFELRWSGSPPQIMKYVNEALRGMWHEVALGETGSLVVQNIFENCLEEDKRPCINEVLEYIDLIAHGQFGNWCIQHICEHGAPMDRSRAIDVVIQNAAEYSMDQYASKVVEKCLKIGGNEFLDRYLDRVSEGRPDRPRIPLIDIASDQYGNYLVQWILQHASLPHREQVASHIRKHMVSLRGSKFGSRVGMLCCNPIYNRQVSTGPPSPGVPRYNRFGYR